MKRALDKTVAAAGLMTATLLAICTPAGAATQVGQTFDPSGGTCPDFTVFQTGSPGNAYVVPGAGVITSWSFFAAAGPPPAVRLKVGREVGPNQFTVVGHSANEAIAPSGLRTFPTRVPVQAGDVIGFFHPAPGGSSCLGTPGFTVQGAPGDLQPGTTATFSPFVARLDISAILEPDADCDDFGDETQDSSVNPHGCDRTAPDAQITKAPKDKTKKKRATFEFTASDARVVTGFECSLDGGAFAACTSPHTVKVKKGKHTFSVRAVDGNGNVDGVPATDNWKVKKRKKR
jgi:hypothetical protein